MNATLERPKGGDIGEPIKWWEIEPLKEPVEVPRTEPVPA